MSVKKFKFVSPGIFIDEIDNSQLPRVPATLGPLVIGRAKRGPALRPIQVNSFSEFVDMFGTPTPGGDVNDPWRGENLSAPMYATYAAQAWLKNNAPLTFVRLLGAEHTAAGSTQAGGAAGWKTTNDNSGMNASNGGTYGLFIIASASSGAEHFANPANTGTLAAIWYVDSGHVRLSGTTTFTGHGSPSGIHGVAEFIPPVGTNYEFKAIIAEANDKCDGYGTPVMTATFNFDETSNKYIRKVFNTDPTLVNTDITQGSNIKNYWLGETYERNLENVCGALSSATATTHAGIILPLGDSTYKPHQMLQGSTATGDGTGASKTGWVFAQDLNNDYVQFKAANMQKLFRFHSLDSGEWNQNNIKISIQDVDYSKNEFSQYGTFTVIIRKMEDNDNRVRVLERFSNVNLNPNDPKYISRVIGDQYMTWDDTERRYTVYGDYRNNSNFVRVEVDEAVGGARVNPLSLPFGFYAPPRYKGFMIFSGSAYTYDIKGDLDNVVELDGHGAAPIQSASFVTGRSTKGAFGQPAVGTSSHGTTHNFPGIPDNEEGVFASLYGGLPGKFTASFVYPTIAFRSSSMEQNVKNAKKAYWGFDSTKYGASATRYEKSNIDLLRAKPGGLNTATSFGGVSDYLDYMWIFSLDELQDMDSRVVYVSGSRFAGTSITAKNATYKQVLDDGYDRFTLPLYGGFDGVDITEQDPFNNTRALVSSANDTTSYAYNSVKRAIDSIADPEVVEFTLAAMPGITNTTLTEHLINICEDRGDALAIVDLEGGFTASHETTQSIEDRLGSSTTTVTNLRDRQLNTSYGCAYYPWVQIRDTINDNFVWVPPSVIAMGALSFSERKSELWFAPAGFTRGGLTHGAGGIPVIQARERLTADQRDRLYEANINPIATFPAEGIVIFGQKTLQVTQSALDRINVRRLLIYVKKEVSRIAATTLFEPNVQVTWNAFLGKIEPFLASVQARMGLTDWKVILDESTTTPELIDRNIMYAKVFLKPARAIEFIALDFTITNSGAAFED